MALGATLATAEPNRIMYNGKELQDYPLNGLELGWYDYGARFYDPTLGRFHTQDRFAEKFNDVSPYQYALNNPIRYIDVNGDSIAVAAQNAVNYVIKNYDNNDSQPARCNIGAVRVFREETGSTDLDMPGNIDDAMLASQILDHVINSPDWVQEEVGDVQELANQEKIVFGLTSDHAVVAVPGESVESGNFSGAKVPMVMDTGSGKRATSQSAGMSWDKTDAAKVVWYRYIGNENVSIPSVTITGKGLTKITPIPFGGF